MEENTPPQEPHIKPIIRGMPWSLRLVLLTLWTISVVFTAYESWHIKVVGNQPFSMLGLVIHCLIVGLFGLIVMTLIENRFVI